MYNIQFIPMVQGHAQPKSSYDALQHLILRPFCMIFYVNIIRPVWYIFKSF